MASVPVTLDAVNDVAGKVTRRRQLKGNRNKPTAWREHPRFVGSVARASERTTGDWILPAARREDSWLAYSPARGSPSHLCTYHNGG